MEAMVRKLALVALIVVLAVLVVRGVQLEWARHQGLQVHDGGVHGQGGSDRDGGERRRHESFDDRGRRQL